MPYCVVPAVTCLRKRSATIALPSLTVDVQLVVLLYSLTTLLRFDSSLFLLSSGRKFCVDFRFHADPPSGIGEPAAMHVYQFILYIFISCILICLIRADGQAFVPAAAVRTFNRSLRSAESHQMILFVFSSRIKALKLWQHRCHAYLIDSIQQLVSKFLPGFFLSAFPASLFGSAWITGDPRL